MACPLGTRHPPSHAKRSAPSPDPENGCNLYLIRGVSDDLPLLSHTSRVPSIKRNNNSNLRHHRRLPSLLPPCPQSTMKVFHYAVVASLALVSFVSAVPVPEDTFQSVAATATDDSDPSSSSSSIQGAPGGSGGGPFGAPGGGGGGSPGGTPGQDGSSGPALTGLLGVLGKLLGLYATNDQAASAGTASSSSANLKMFIDALASASASLDDAQSQTDSLPSRR
jgi:hypothetical protein